MLTGLLCMYDLRIPEKFDTATGQQSALAASRSVHTERSPLALALHLVDENSLASYNHMPYTARSIATFLCNTT